MIMGLTLDHNNNTPSHFQYVSYPFHGDEQDFPGDDGFWW